MNDTTQDKTTYSDIEDDIIIKDSSGGFKVFSHGNVSDFDAYEKVSKPSREVLDTGLEEKALAPLTPAVYTGKKAEFYFNVDDKEEISKQQNKLNEIKIDIKQYSLKKITEKITEANNINFVPQLETKLNSIIYSFLKHTRTRLDVEEVLTGRIINLGLGLEKEKSEKILNLLTEIRSKIDESKGRILNDLNAEDYVSSANKQNPQREQLSNLDPRQKIEIKPINSNIPFINRDTSSSFKPKISDTKQKPRVISPVEELGEVTIAMFRRLSNEPAEAAQKIIDKINSFGRESIITKSLAIKSWRKSEVYGIYLLLGRESIEKNLSIDKIINQKALAGEKTITLEEFQAISDVNKKVKF